MCGRAVLVHRDDADLEEVRAQRRRRALERVVERAAVVGRRGGGPAQPIGSFSSTACTSTRSWNVVPRARARARRARVGSRARGEGRARAARARARARRARELLGRVALVEVVVGEDDLGIDIFLWNWTLMVRLAPSLCQYVDVVVADLLAPLPASRSGATRPPRRSRAASTGPARRRSSRCARSSGRSAVAHFELAAAPVSWTRPWTKI